MTLGETAAQVATSGECELTKFTFSCIAYTFRAWCIQAAKQQFEELLTLSRSWCKFIDPESIKGLVGLSKYE